MPLPPQSKITSQGQISIPAEIRKKLGVGPGSVIEWEEEGGRVVVRRAGRHTSEDIHRAVFERTPRTKTTAELKEGIATYVRKKHARR